MTLVATNSDPTLEQNNSDTEDSKALVLSLPENWPSQQASQLGGPHCTGVTHTAVNKAQCHLELLQNAIEDWFSKKPFTPSTKQNESISKTPTTNTTGYSKKELEVVGNSRTSTYYYYNNDPGVPYLGADEVVNEVVNLLAKLENDRRETEEAINAERGRVIELAERIDKLSEAKLVQIPVAVQAEHEACIEDIAELQWHVQSKKKVLKKSKRRHEKSERLHNDITKEIDFITEHDPLVREKLNLELEKIRIIKGQNMDSMKELQETEEKLRDTERRNKEAHKAAEVERKKLQMELDKAEENLQSAKNAVKTAREQFEELGKRIQATKQSIGEKTEESKVMESRNSNDYETQKMLQSTVDELLRTLRHAEYQVKIVDQERYESQQLEDRTLATQQTQRSEMRDGVNHMEDKYIFLRRQADEEQNEYEQMQNKLTDCEKQRITDEKNLERMHKELEKTHQDLAETMEEFTKVAQEHSQVTKNLESDEKKVQFVEDSLKQTIEQLQKQIEDEISTRDSLIMRIETDTRDLAISKKDGKVKRAKLRKLDEDMDKAVKIMTGKVEALRIEAAEKRTVVNELEQTLKQLINEKNLTETELDAKINDLRPKQQKLKADLESLEKQLADLDWQINMMNKKIKDVFAQSGMINKSKVKYMDAITMLQDQLKSLEIDLTSQNRKEDTLNVQVNTIQARLRDKEDKHRRLQEERKEVEMNMQNQYKESLQMNKQLAGTYRSLQNETYEFREQLLATLFDKVTIEDSVKDCKQVSRLQSRMHAALQSYLQYKRRYTELRMIDMQIRSKVNTTTSGALQEKIDESLMQITTFLDSQMDVLMQGQRVSPSKQQVIST